MDPAELLRRAPDAFTSVRATLATSVDHALAAEARNRWLATSEFGRELLDAMRSDTWTRLADQLEREGDGSPDLTRYWIEPPDRVRFEQEESVTLRVGDEAWAFQPGYYVFRAPLWPIPLFFDGGWLAEELTFVSSAPDAIAERDCLNVQARPKADLSDRLKDGADAYELAVDVERGAVLRLRRFLAGTVFETQEVVEIAYDEELPAELWEAPEVPPREPATTRTPRARGRGAASS